MKKSTGTSKKMSSKKWKLNSIVLILILSIIVISGAVEKISTEGQDDSGLTSEPKIIKVQTTEGQEEITGASGLNLQPVPETVKDTAQGPQIIQGSEGAGIEKDESAGNSENPVIQENSEQNPEQNSETNLQEKIELKNGIRIFGLQNNLKNSNSGSSTEENNVDNTINTQETVEKEKSQTESETVNTGQKLGIADSSEVSNSEDEGSEGQSSVRERKSSEELHNQKNADEPAESQEEIVDKQEEEPDKNLIIVKNEGKTEISENENPKSSEAPKSPDSYSKQKDSLIQQENSKENPKQASELEEEQGDGSRITLEVTDPAKEKQQSPEIIQQDKIDEASPTDHKEDFENPEKQEAVEEKAGPVEKEENKDSDHVINTGGQSGPITEEAETSDGQQAIQPVEFFPEQGQGTDTYFDDKEPADEQSGQGEKADKIIKEDAEQQSSPVQGTDNPGSRNKEDPETGPRLDIIKDKIKDDEVANPEINQILDPATDQIAKEKPEIAGRACPAGKSQKCETESSKVKMKPCTITYSPENKGIKSEPKTVTFNWICPQKAENKTQNEGSGLNPEANESKDNKSEGNNSKQNVSEENGTDEDSWQNIKFILSRTYSSDTFYTTHENVKIEYDGPEALAGQKIDIYIVKKISPDFSEEGIPELENEEGSSGSAIFEKLVREDTESYIQIPAVLDENGDLLPLSFDPLPAGDYWTVITLAGEGEINPSEGGSESYSKSNPEPENQKEILLANYFKVLEYEMRAEIPGAVKEGEAFGVNLSLEGQPEEGTGNYTYWAVLINEDAYKANLEGNSGRMQAGIENFLSGINFLVDSESGSSDSGTSYQNAFSSELDSSKAKFKLEVQKLIGEGKGAITIGEDNQRALSLTSEDLVPGNYLLFAGAYEKDKGLAGIVQKKLTIYVPKVVSLNGKASASPEDGPGSYSNKKKLPSILESKDSVLNSLETVSFENLSPKIGDAAATAKIFIKNPPKVPSLILGFMITLLSGLAIMKIRRQP